MSEDFSGPIALDRPTTPVPGIAGTPVPPARALARRPRPEIDSPLASPTAPHEFLPESPLKGSGLDLVDVFTTTDRIATRQGTGTVALEVGLEQARNALLRSRPGDTLAALDDIWIGAKRTEEGWYLRSGALSLLGLPAEADLVAGDGLLIRPASSALRFLQSLARAAIGDFAGARATLQPAITRAPFDPILQVQHALLQAAGGDPRAAEAALTRLRAVAAEHPALAWGKGALAALIADDTRHRSRAWRAHVVNDMDLDAFDERGVVNVMQGAPTAETAHGPAVNEASLPLAEHSTSDPLSSALERFGARLVGRSSDDSVQDARRLIRALSAGGPLASAIAGEQAHAARVVLMTIVGGASGEGSDAPPTLRHLVSQLTPMLQQGRAADARAVVQRQRMVAREPVSRVLFDIIRGASRTSTVHDTVTDRNVPRTPTDPFEPIIRGEPDRTPLIAIRLGLGLLEESATTRAADPSLRFGPPSPGLSGDRVALSERPTGGSVPRISNVEHAGEGWGAAQSGAEASIHGDRAAVTPIRLVAVVGVALAVGALATGHGGLAIALAVGAAWLGLHGGTSSGKPSHTSELEGARLRAVGEDAQTPPSP